VKKMAQQYRCEFTTRADGRKLRRAAERKQRNEVKKINAVIEE
jgi:hypothetical protein